MNRWKLNGKGIVWNVSEDKNLPHCDHLEMSGTRASQYVEYGVDEMRKPILSQVMVYPQLRTIPNNTSASTYVPYKNELLQPIFINGIEITEQVYEITFDGILCLKSNTDSGIEVHRTIFPTRKNPASIEIVTLINKSNKNASVTMPKLYKQDIARGCYGIYLIEVEQRELSNKIIEPGESIDVTVVFSGRKILEPAVCIENGRAEEKMRREFIDSINSSLRLETPNPLLNQAFNFAKIRACESIFENKCGLLHSPGGLSYYSAIWANDQVEYAGPFFPFVGDKNSIEASINAYKLFIPFMGPDYTPIPSSIISEGVDIWEGVGDRGDAAMYAYGASRFALFLGDIEVARELWPAIKWCLTYCERKRTPEGVIASDSDELEGRFSTGKTNLSTSCLTYGGLITSAILAKELGDDEASLLYTKRAKALEQSIEDYFGADINGYHTYRYHEGNERLRAWICIPLTMGIYRRKKGTINALLSKNLWTEDGLATQSGDSTFWDRSTLYGLRGIFSSGDSEKAMDKLVSYSNRRTLGEHVPYAVEAYPEGNQRHLSAESALYCRVYTEGIFGITPMGLKAFAIAPSMPQEWDKMALRDIHICGTHFDIEVTTTESGYDIEIKNEAKVKHYLCKKDEQIVVTM